MSQDSAPSAAPSEYLPRHTREANASPRQEVSLRKQTSCPKLPHTFQQVSLHLPRSLRSPMKNDFVFLHFSFYANTSDPERRARVRARISAKEYANRQSHPEKHVSHCLFNV